MMRGVTVLLLSRSLDCGTFAVATVAVLLTFASTLLGAQRHSFDLLRTSVDDIQSAVSAGALTYERLVELYLARIERYDKNGPRLNAIIHINPRAREIARELDRERQFSGLRSQLHGIPIAVKDNVDTEDLPTTGGSVLFNNSVPPRDATVIQRLRQAGAIIFLKTNLDEFALGSQGLSSHGGQTLNPYDLRHSPGGSSGGTAVAVAAGFATLGVATETGMSTRGPASNTALVGVVPTRGLVSRAGVIPISFTQDRVGVHATSVRDAALLLSHISGFDAEDLSTAASLGMADRDYSKSVHALPTGLRVGILNDLFRREDEAALVNTLVRQSLAKLADRVTLVDRLTTGLDLIAQFPTMRVNNYELRFAFDAYLQRRGVTSPVKFLAEVIASGKYLKGLETRYDTAMKVRRLDDDEEYLRRLHQQRVMREALLSLMERQRLDALVYPAKPVGAPRIGQADLQIGDTPLSSIVGLPAIVINVGLTHDGLPIALEVLGRPFGESVLFRIAAAYEELRGPRPLPPTTPHLRGDVFEH